MKSSQILRSYLRGARSRTGAGTVSLFVPASASGLSNALVLHAGPRPVEEMADTAAAIRSLPPRETAAGPEGADGLGAAAPIPAAEAGCWLIPVPGVESLAGSGGLFEEAPPDERPLRRASDRAGPPPPAPSAWLGFRFDADEASRTSPPLACGPGDWSQLLTLASLLAWHVQRVSHLLDDPITGLPGRSRLQSAIDEAVADALANGTTASLLMINPDGFEALNRRYGRERGDAVVQGIARRLRETVRGADLVARYGGVIFAALLPRTPPDGALLVAEKILHSLESAPVVDGIEPIGFSIGMASLPPETDSETTSLDLIRRGDRALEQAKRAGGGCIASAPDDDASDAQGQVDRLAGIFTGEMSRDYRNMGLLWDSLRFMAGNPGADELRRGVAERLFEAVKADVVAVLPRPAAEEAARTVGLERAATADGPPRPLKASALDPAERALVARCGDGRSALREEADDGRTLRFAVPLISGDDLLGSLFLRGRRDLMTADAADLVFIEALGGQLALALDRARLQEQERGRLRAELQELQVALQKSRLVYASEQMEELLSTARRVAPTDATVLITGESGTGKELLAHTLHQLSPRRSKPLVVVDCGAISSSLIDSELFGHERGAYTGAQQRRVGRLAEADGGTVLLDEIGELPLDVQSKLLRFVQERQLTPVGSARPREVDVRVLAATNRKLANEVAAGTFREDLYHRLNVVRLEIPPLRDRPQDIRHLAEHFVTTYAEVYRKRVSGLSDGAADRLLAHHWPGNVRELQNLVMRAVILCEAGQIRAEDLEIDAEAPAAAQPTGDYPAAQPEPSAPAADAAAREPAPLRPWHGLRESLAREVGRALEPERPLALPLGRWLAEDLLLEADAAADGVGRRAAARAGLAETTFRRRIGQARRRQRAGLATRSAGWPAVRAALRAIVAQSDESDEGGDLLAQAEQLLLREILARIPEDVQTGATLLGVTPPTYRRRIADLA